MTNHKLALLTLTALLPLTANANSSKRQDQNTEHIKLATMIPGATHGLKLAKDPQHMITVAPKPTFVAPQLSKTVQQSELAFIALADTSTIEHKNVKQSDLFALGKSAPLTVLDTNFDFKSLFKNNSKTQNTENMSRASKKGVTLFSF